MDLEWQTVPRRIRPALRITWNAVGPALLIPGLLYAWNLWRHQVSPPIIQSWFLVVMFAWESLFFAYGEVRTDREVS
jgi:hypothetical protein